MNVKKEIPISCRNQEQYNGGRNNTMAVLVWENRKVLRGLSDKIHDENKMWSPRYI